MTKILFILLFTSSLFSQKLWEIEVDPSDYLRDVVEIPNSDLLLFTYNTGKLEIRNSQDGSFVNHLIRKPNESGELRISNNGQLYYYQSSYDTLEYRDILTNEAIIRVSPEIEGLEGNPIFDGKSFRRFELYDNNTKIVGNMIYFDSQDSRNDVNYFIIYDIPSRTVEYKDDPYEYKYNYISKSYLSPDDNYFIEAAYNKPYARMFNLETREYEFEFDEGNGDIMPVGIFINDNEMRFRSPKKIDIYSFPQMKYKYSIQLPQEFEFNISGNSGLSICEDVLFVNVYKRIEGVQNKFDEWNMLLDRNNFNVIFDSRTIQTNLEYTSSFAIDDCNLLVTDKDFNNRPGFVVCYDFNTLDIEKVLENNIFPNPTNDIINIDTETPTNLKLFDIFGNKILEDYNTKLDISNLSPGTYYIRFLGQTKMVVKI